MFGKWSLQVEGDSVQRTASYLESKKKEHFNFYLTIIIPYFINY